MLSIRRLGPGEARASASALADVLVDCVEGGASVSFMWPFSKTAATEFFEKVAHGVAAGERVLLAGCADSVLVGMVQLLTAMPPISPTTGQR